MNSKIETEELAVNLLRRELDGSGLIHHCGNCEHHRICVNETDALCGLDETGTPVPIRIVLHGCPAWELEIPF